jgi:hypothetical protein
MKFFTRLFTIFILALLFLALPLAVFAAPLLLQSPVPDPGGFMVYGVSWALVGSAIVGLLLYFGSIGDEGAVLFTAAWSTVGYVLIQNLPDLETLLPWLPVYLPQVLTAILVFAAQLGIIQIARAGKRRYQLLKR